MNQKKSTMELGAILISVALWAHAQEPHAQEIDHAAMHHAAAPIEKMSGQFASGPMSREASGTSWQPDSTPMAGLHRMSDEWSTMLHGVVDLLYDDQGGPRGDTDTFAVSMLMGMAWRQWGIGTFGARAMVSLDPLNGRSGYPLLFQTGETANGSTPLIDRQHPHDLFMELSASYSVPLSAQASVYGYVGLPGEPALGPAAFMHRFSGMDNPEAPLTHHWLDSTHITFGVATLGYVWRDIKIEASGFNGREPDQSRYNIETRHFDSASARLSWNPTPAWALQISRGHLDSPEQLEPAVSVRRTTASASYQHNFSGNEWQTTLAWGRNEKNPGTALNGWLLESALRIDQRYTLFGRAERVENGELFMEDELLHHAVFDVTKLSVGGIYDFFLERHLRLGVGALVSRYDAPAALDPVYGASPHSSMIFLRLRLE